MLTKAQIQSISALSDRKERNLQNAFVAEGEKLVGEIISAGWEITHLYQTEELFSEAELITVREMSRISQLKTPTKVLAVVRKPKRDYKVINPNKNLVLALDCIQNPGNLGTIIRLADWFAVSDIVCSRDTVDCYSPKVIQATMGAILRVRVHYVDLPVWLSQQHCEIYGTLLDGDNVYTSSLSKSGIVLMGNEGKGLSSEVQKLVSKRLLIPSFREGSESLNVSVATAIICSEFKRRNLDGSRDALIVK